MMDIINERYKLGTKFNATIGWGHIIRQNDQWNAAYIHGSEWNFYGATADQGLLYHWTKYVKKNVTIVFLSSLERWGTTEEGGDVTFLNKTGKWYDLVDGAQEGSPRVDFRHFSGKKKPWWRKPLLSDDESSTNPLEIDIQKWYNLLRRVMNRTDLQIDFEQDFPMKDSFPPLGMFSTKKAVHFAKRQKHVPWDVESDWNQAKAKDLSDEK